MRRDSGRHIDIIRLIMKYVHAVKDRFRQFQRPLRGISAIHFGYRQVLQLNILLFGRWTASVFLAYLFLGFLSSKYRIFGNNWVIEQNFEQPA